MSWPPMLMRIRIKNEEHNFGLWLPLFLLILLIIIILLVLSPLILIAVIVLWPSGWGEWGLKAIWAAIISLWSIRGLEVEVREKDKYVQVSVI